MARLDAGERKLRELRDQVAATGQPLAKAEAELEGRRAERQAVNEEGSKRSAAMERSAAEMDRKLTAARRELATAEANNGRAEGALRALRAENDNASTGRRTRLQVLDHRDVQIAAELAVFGDRLASARHEGLRLASRARASRERLLCAENELLRLEQLSDRRRLAASALQRTQQVDIAVAKDRIAVRALSLAAIENEVARLKASNARCEWVLRKVTGRGRGERGAPVS